MAEPHIETSATVEHPATGSEGHAMPSAFGLTAPMFIGLAMLVVIALMLWKKVPSAIGAALDKKIALIRDQLAEAEALRKEAEGIKAEYEAKAKAAGKESKAMLERAKHEAEAILVKARADAEALVERRGRMAEEKIAAEERAAVDQLRATAADAARQAAAQLISDRLDDNADKALVDQAIGGLGR
jgi:F-type H+-transporting ATPase subunit b